MFHWEVKALQKRSQENWDQRRAGEETWNRSCSERMVLEGFPRGKPRTRKEGHKTKPNKKAVGELKGRDRKKYQHTERATFRGLRGLNPVSKGNGKRIDTLARNFTMVG